MFAHACRLVGGLIPLLCLLGCSPAEARGLAAIRQSGELRCGGAIRPGLAVPLSATSWRGLEPEICRALSVVLLGPGGKWRFLSHGLPADPNPPAEPVDVSFLTGDELPAPPPPGVVRVTGIDLAIAVPPSAPARHLADLGAALVCAEPGTDAERALGPYLRAHAPSAQAFMFQEDEERRDALASGRCGALAGEAATLASWASDTPMRLLPEPYATLPLYALADPEWSATLATTVAKTLLQPHQDTPP